MKYDLTGQKFHNLTVIKKADFVLYKNNTTWECKCDCGNITYATTHKLLNGDKKSCGCRRHREHITLIGQKFNSLTVIGKADFTRKENNITWECKCDCGKITYATTSQLQTGVKKSCGCRKNKPNAKDLTGQRFGRLTVIKRNGTNKHRRAIWRCKCDCGKYKDVCAAELLSGNTKSCGCWFKEKHKYN